MAMFGEQDEEDDINGVDSASRDVIPEIATVINRTMRESRFMLFFINGSDEEIILSPFEATRKELTEYKDQQHCIVPDLYSDVFKDDKLGDGPLISTQAFPQPPCVQLARHIEIGDGSRNVQIEVEANDCSLGDLMTERAESLHVHDAMARAATPRGNWSKLRWCWVERCPNLYVVFPSGASEDNKLETIWVSDLLKARCIWCKGRSPLWGEVRRIPYAYFSVQHLHLRSCPSIEYAVPLWSPSFPSLETLHIINCGGLKHVFEQDNEEHLGSVKFPTLTTIHLHDLPTLRQICKGAGRKVGRKKPAVEVEKDVWDALEWDGVDAGHHPSLYEAPVHSRFYRQGRLLRGTVLSFMSPPFLQCYTLRFLGLDHCTDDNTLMKLEGGQDSATRWAFVKSLWVIDLHYTDWVEILSEENIKLMSNLMEVNIEGVRWPRWKSSHQMHYKRLSNLQHLRIIKPKYDEATVETASSDISDSFLLMDNTSLEILDLSGSNKVMGSISSKAGHLRMIVLDGCDGLGDVMLSNNSSLRSFSFDGYGPAAASHRTTTVELPVEMSRPKQPPTNANKKDAIKTSIISLQGCGRLDKLFLRGLPNLVELDLSGCAIKVLDFGSMVVDVPMLKRLFLIGCEHLCAIKWYSNGELVARKMQMICIDTRPGSRRVLGCAWPTSLGAQQKSFGLQVHAIITNARLARSLYYPISTGGSSFGNSCCFNIRITSSAALSTNNGAVIKPVETMSKDMRMVRSSSKQHRQHNSMEEGLVIYGDIIGDGLAPMQAFPQTPMAQSDHHIEIVGGDGSLQSEAEDSYAHNLASLMSYYTKSIHVHDVSTCSNTMAANYWYLLRSCHVERCPSLHAVFPPGGVNASLLQTIWASNLLNTRCVWSKGGVTYDQHLQGLRHLHLHLHCCPNLWFALVMSWHRRPSFPSLETLHIIHCGDLRHVFVPDDEELQHKSSVQFPELTTIHLYDLSALQQICEGAETVAPMLETIKIRGCPNLRRLPALRGREAGMKLEWDGVDAGNHPSLCKTPVHSRFYKRRMLRRTVLRHRPDQCPLCVLE
nr:unnamed protein product [Digitaria exilis]